VGDSVKELLLLIGFELLELKLKIEFMVVVVVDVDDEAEDVGVGGIVFEMN